ncbi:hypothetical protein Q4485_11205 [Granulosicoccaceae sp. 1_MG-2023]|nr:hypothetical protein [Granulosicoccaceae sp. 1_MG-2023]
MKHTLLTATLAYALTAPALAGSGQSGTAYIGTDQVDLSLNLGHTGSTIQTGDTLAITLQLANRSTDTIATGLWLNLSLPEHLRYDGNECIAGGGTLSCPLGNLGAQSGTTVSLPFTALSSGTAALQGLLQADQSDADQSDNRASLQVPVSTRDTDADLVVDFTAGTDKDALAVTVTNAGTGSSDAQTLNIEAEATTNNAGLSLDSDDLACLPGLSLMICDVEPLAAGSAQTFVFSISSQTDTTVEITASVDWDQDQNPGNNTQTLTLALVEEDSSSDTPEPTDTTTTDTAEDGGGGGGAWWLSGLLLGGYARRRHA